MDFLSLLCCCSLACSDSPNRLVSDNDLSHFLCRKTEEHILDLRCNNLEMLSGLSLLEVLTYAEDNAETVCKSKLDLLYESSVCLTVVLSSLRVAEDSIFATS